MQSPPGANIRRRGEDITAGGEVVSAGTRLQPQHLGLGGGGRVARLRVCRRPRVALFASGDELVMPGGPLSPGKIYNSNLFTATALLQALGCEVIELRTVEDTLEATVQALRQGCGRGRPRARVRRCLGRGRGPRQTGCRGARFAGHVEYRHSPGKPVAFSRVDGTPFIGSPGNPVSLFVTFLLFVRPFILRMRGAQRLAPAAAARQGRFRLAATGQATRVSSRAVILRRQGYCAYRRTPEPFVWGAEFGDLGQRPGDHPGAGDPAR